MAYQPRPPYDTNSPVQEHQHRVPSWTHHHRLSGQDHLPAIGRQPSPGLVEPESEDSDVSAAEDDLSAFALPIGLPPAPSKSSLESQQLIMLRLEDLERHENHNIKKHNRLREKRQRMDEKIGRKRAKQDEMIKAIMSARGRRDSRIKQRRDREDIAFQRFYEDLEEEEARLRQRLKRLKRGLPMDDNPSSNRRESYNSLTSPPTTSYSTVPPPAKRRRTSQPMHQDAPPSQPPELMHQLPPVERQPYPYLAHHGPPPPATPYSNSGHHQLYHPPPLQSPTNRHSRPPPDLGPHPPNGYHNSPNVPPAAPTPPVSTPIHPSRPPMSTYDTRPPPPVQSSGFAAVNQPPHSGFAAVNARHIETPPVSNAQHIRESLHKPSSTPADETPIRPSIGEEKGSSGSGSGANKRTPSTTHPYQMSEAFANRHHHCERIDSINRGVWTWYGHGGTQDRPTAQPTEMYLKCNHENCGRIDWRTVHGLQCHIVKNHEQPKGTIGSLEKALAAYGVPVQDIEEIEKRDGLGSGGTMADPKNVKVRAKIRDSSDKRELSGRDTPLSAVAPSPITKQQQRSANSDSPTTFSIHKSETERRPFSINDHRVDGSARSPIDLERPAQNRPATGFAAVNSGWANINQKPTPPILPPLSHDQDSRATATPERQLNPIPGESRSPPAPSFWSGWPRPMFSSVKPTPPPAETGAHSGLQSQFSHAPPSTSSTADHAKVSIKTPSEGPMGQQNSVRTEDVAPVLVQHSDKDVASLPEDSHTNSTEVKDVLMKDAPAPAASDKEQKGESREKENEVVLSEPTETGPAIKVSEENIDPAPSVVREEEASKQEQRTEEIPVVTPTKHTSLVVKDEAKVSPPSPEMTTKRVTSRRESRRASVATATSSRLGTDRGREDDREANPSRAATENTMDEEGDTIEVNSMLPKADQKEKERLKEEEINQTPPKRLANGRFTRRSLR